MQDHVKHQSYFRKLVIAFGLVIGITCVFVAFQQSAGVETLVAIAHKMASLIKVV